MIQILNNLAMFVGYVVLGTNVLVGSVIFGSLWLDGVRTWARHRRRVAVPLPVPADELAERRVMRIRAG